MASDPVHRLSPARFEQGEDGQWLLTDHAGLEAAVVLPAIGCRLELARVYDKVET